MRKLMRALRQGRHPPPPGFEFESESAVHFDPPPLIPPPSKSPFPSSRTASPRVYLATSTPYRRPSRRLIAPFVASINRRRAHRVFQRSFARVLTLSHVSLPCPECAKSFTCRPARYVAPRGVAIFRVPRGADLSFPLSLSSSTVRQPDWCETRSNSLWARSLTCTA